MLGGVENPSELSPAIGQAPCSQSTAAISLRNFVIYFSAAGCFLFFPPSLLPASSHPLVFPVLLSVRYSVFSLQLSLAATKLSFFFF